MQKKIVPGSVRTQTATPTKKEILRVENRGGMAAGCFFSGQNRLLGETPAKTKRNAGYGNTDEAMHL